MSRGRVAWQTADHCARARVADKNPRRPNPTPPYTSLSKHFVSTRRLIRQPAGVRTNSVDPTAQGRPIQHGGAAAAVRG
jgi:hypothetical protein